MLSSDIILLLLYIPPLTSISQNLEKSDIVETKPSPPKCALLSSSYVYQSKAPVYPSK